MPPRHKILIVDDDKTFLAALSRAFTAQDYAVAAFDDATAALAAARNEKFHGAVIDCVLNLTSGLHLALDLLSVQPHLRIVFISGLISDKEFLQDLHDQVPDSKFFRKPFKAEELLDHFRNEFIGPVSDILFNGPLFSSRPADRNDVQGLARSPEIAGTDLPRLISNILQSKVTGSLSLEPARGSQSLIFFRDGKVVGVKIADAKRYFVQVLFELRNVDRELIAKTLESSAALEPGERLTAAKLISPDEASRIAGLEYGLQISELIYETKYRVGFQDGHQPTLSAGELKETDFWWIVVQWTMTRLNEKSLRAFFEPVFDCQIVEKISIKPDHYLLSVPPLNALRGLISSIASGVTLRQLLLDHFENEDLVLMAVYVLTCAGFIFFDRAHTLADWRAESDGLEEILEKIKGRDSFAVLGVSREAGREVIENAYDRWSKTFDPRFFPPKTPDSVKALSEMVWRRMNDAHTDVLKQVAERPTPQPENRDKGDDLHIEILLDGIRNRLKQYDGMTALKKLEELIMSRGMKPSSEFTLYCTWAQLLTLDKSKTAPDSIETIRIQLERIPHEHRQNATYYFVRGLFEKKMDNGEAAKKNFNHALFLDPGLIEAKRELHVLTLSKKK